MKEHKKVAQVILFPGLVNRLVEKGMDLLVNREFEEAAELLLQAVELEETDASVRFGLVVALVELGRYQEAKNHCQSLLKEGIGDYFELMEMYVMILLELNEYEEMAATIQVLFDENQVPFAKEEHFEKMLAFSKRMKNEQPTDAVKGLEIEQLDLLTKTNQEQLMLISQLKDDNVRKYLEEIKAYLQAEEGHPFLKTMLLMILKEQEIQDECIIGKLSRQVGVVPAALPNLHMQPFFVEANKHLEDVLEHESPSLLQLAQQLLERHSFIMYPIEPEEDSKHWAAAFHILAEHYQGITGNEQDIIETYNGEIVKVEKALVIIKQIEEISSL
ncbi:MAG: tetratricopeptide repeat protein [Bacillus sp. (in: firmicutes)]